MAGGRNSDRAGSPGDATPVQIARERRRGRGATSNGAGRFETQNRYIVDDGWDSAGHLPAIRTEEIAENARTIINRVTSPDISFDRSINVYRGCEHGCIYCFARPTHCYLGFSAGLDFETRLVVKKNAADLLRKELAKPGYRPRTIVLGTNTDPYQPIERQHRLTRSILQVLKKARHPVAIVTKSAQVLRDMDILAPMAKQGLARVALSVTTLDRRLARAMEPRASTPAKRLEALRHLADAGIPATVMVAPIIPGLTDTEMEAILAAAAEAGVQSAGYILLRLPGEVAGLFEDWLFETYPERARRVLSLLRDTRQGALYRADWGTRMRGTGAYAHMIAARFARARRKYGMVQAGQEVQEVHELRTDLFRPPTAAGTKCQNQHDQHDQPDLFDRL